MRKATIIIAVLVLVILLVSVFMTRSRLPLPPFLDYGKDELYAKLTSGEVSKAWWKLDEATRKQLAIRIIEWWSVPLSIERVRYLTSKGILVEETPVCVGHASIRCAIFGTTEIAGADNYYLSDGEWLELDKQPCFHLPVALAVVHPKDIPVIGHELVTMQIAKDSENFSSWIFFQYGDSDIKPGDSQMQVPCEVALLKPQKLCVNEVFAPVVHTWELNKKCLY